MKMLSTVLTLSATLLLIPRCEGGNDINYSQDQSTQNNTLLYELKLDNKGNAAEFYSGVTVLIGGASTNYTVEHSHGNFWDIVIEKLSNFTGSQCVDIVVDASQMPSFKNEYNNAPCISYDETLDLNPFVASNGTDPDPDPENTTDPDPDPANTTDPDPDPANTTDPDPDPANTTDPDPANTTDPDPDSTSNSTQAQTTQDPESVYQVAAEKDAVIDRFEDSTSTLSLLYKGSVAVGGSSLLISMISFLNLVAVYYFLGIELPQSIEELFRVILKGSTKNIILPDDYFNFMEGSRSINSKYEEFSISTNALGLFGQFLIVFLVLRVLRKLWVWFFSKKDSSYQELADYCQYFIGSLPLLIVGLFFNLKNSVAFQTPKDKVNFIIMVALSAGTLFSLLSFVFLLNQAEDSEQIEDIYMRTNIKIQKKSINRILYLEIILMVMIPALSFYNIQLFWLLTLGLILLQLGYMKARFYINPYTFITRVANKVALLANHLFCCFYFFESELGFDGSIRDIVADLHFYLIVLVCALEVISVIEGFCEFLYCKFNALCRSSSNTETPEQTNQANENSKSQNQKSEVNFEKSEKLGTVSLGPKFISGKLTKQKTMRFKEVRKMKEEFLRTTSTKYPQPTPQQSESSKIQSENHKSKQSKSRVVPESSPKSIVSFAQKVTNFQLKKQIFNPGEVEKQKWADECENASQAKTAVVLKESTKKRTNFQLKKPFLKPSIPNHSPQPSEDEFQSPTTNTRTRGKSARKKTHFEIRGSLRKSGIVDKEQQLESPIQCQESLTRKDFQVQKELTSLKTKAHLRMGQRSLGGANKRKKTIKKNQLDNLTSKVDIEDFQ